MIGRRAGDAAQDVVRAEAPELPANALARDAVPVRVHAPFGRRVGDDRRRPLDRVDLCHHGRGDQPGLVVELVVAPVPVFPTQRVADRVVLADEERMEEAEADPEIPAGAHRVEERIERRGVQPVVADVELAVRPRACEFLEGLVVAVDLRAVPPVGVLRGVDRGHSVDGRFGRLPRCSGPSSFARASRRRPSRARWRSAWTDPCRGSSSRAPRTGSTPRPGD